MTTTIASSGTEGAVDELLISSDSHVMEPGDLWATRLPKGLRDQAPTFPDTVSEQAKPGGWDPNERLKEMAVDGVSLEVLYATRGMTLFRIEDVPLQEACVRAFNDWLIEYCAASPDRLFGIGLISLYDVDHAVAELERCRNAGLRGAMIWQNPPEDLPFSSDRYDPFWAAAQDLQMPVSLHILTGHGYMQRRRGGTEHYRASVNLKIAEVMKQPLRHHLLPGAGPLPQPQDRARGERDRLDPVRSPAVGLLPGQAPPSRAGGPRRTRCRSEYLADQIYATFFNDAIGTRYLSSWGADACMWSNDYPHAKLHLAELAQGDRRAPGAPRRGDPHEGAQHQRLPPVRHTGPRSTLRRTTMSYDLLLKNGRVVDGSGGPSYEGDVAVVDGRIVETGRLGSSAKRVIDVQGQVIAPRLHRQPLPLRRAGAVGPALHVRLLSRGHDCHQRQLLAGARSGET